MGKTLEKKTISLQTQIGKKRSLLKIFYCLKRIKENCDSMTKTAFKKWFHEIEKFSYKNRLNLMKITLSIEEQKVFFLS